MKSNESAGPRPEFRGGKRTRDIAIEGMKGAACVAKVEQALKQVRGIDVASVSAGHASISATILDARAACAAIVRAGYRARKGTRPA